MDLYFNFLRYCSPECYVETRQGRAEAWVHVSMDPNNWLRVHQSLNSFWYDQVFVSHGTVRKGVKIGPWYWAKTPDCLSYEDLDISDTGACAWILNDGLVRKPGRSWMESHRVSMVATVEGLRGWLRDSFHFGIFQRLKVCSRLVNEDEFTLATTAPKPEYRSVCYYEWPEAFFGGEYTPGKLENISIF